MTEFFSRHSYVAGRIWLAQVCTRFCSSWKFQEIHEPSGRHRIWFAGELPEMKDGK